MLNGTPHHIQSMVKRCKWKYVGNGKITHHIPQALSLGGLFCFRGYVTTKYKGVFRFMCKSEA